MGLAAVLAAAILFLIGPRPDLDTTTTARDVPTDPGQLEVYLAEVEARFEDLRPGEERRILWASPEEFAKTGLGIGSREGV